MIPAPSFCGRPELVHAPVIGKYRRSSAIDGTVPSCGWQPAPNHTVEGDEWPMDACGIRTRPKSTIHADGFVDVRAGAPCLRKDASIHSPALLNQRNFNDIGVRGFNLIGAPSFPEHSADFTPFSHRVRLSNWRAQLLARFRFGVPNAGWALLALTFQSLALRRGERPHNLRTARGASRPWGCRRCVRAFPA